MNLMMSAAPGISAFPNDENLHKWTGTITGPEGTPYEGLTFKVSFDFPVSYPLVAPTVLFKTPIYHPNIDFSGRICLDILKDKWSAIYNVQSVLLSLQSLLGEPNKLVCSRTRVRSIADNVVTVPVLSMVKLRSYGTKIRPSTKGWCLHATATLLKTKSYFEST